VQTKMGRPKKADAQGHNPVFFRGASAVNSRSEPTVPNFHDAVNPYNS
jgi:hypothetical protein